MSSLLRNLVPNSESPELRGEKVILRLPQLGDYDAWARIRGDSRNFLEPWEPSWSTDALSRTAFRRRLRRYSRDVRDERGIAFFIFRREDGALVAGITLSNIGRGVTQSCSVGYWTGERQGYMTDALSAVIRFVFEGLRLHRLEAACVPTNLPSRTLLQKCGLTEEGAAREFLCINGVWQDHILFGMVSTDPRPQNVKKGAVRLVKSA